MCTKVCSLVQQKIPLLCACDKSQFCRHPFALQLVWLLVTVHQHNQFACKKIINGTTENIGLTFSFEPQTLNTAIQSNPIQFYSQDDDDDATLSNQFWLQRGQQFRRFNFKFLKELNCMAYTDMYKKCVRDNHCCVHVKCMCVCVLYVRVHMHARDRERINSSAITQYQLFVSVIKATFCFLLLLL